MAVLNEFVAQTGRIPHAVEDRLPPQGAETNIARLRPVQQTSGIDRELQETRERLKLEIGALGRRGNLNLVIGLLTSLGGVCVLGYFVYETNVDTTDGWRYLIHYLSRISIALFIQVFAYFFLRLYKNGLEDIKYYSGKVYEDSACVSWLSTELSTKSVDIAKFSGGPRDELNFPRTTVER